MFLSIVHYIPHCSHPYHICTSILYNFTMYWVFVLYQYKYVLDCCVSLEVFVNAIFITYAFNALAQVLHIWHDSVSLVLVIVDVAVVVIIHAIAGVFWDYLVENYCSILFKANAGYLQLIRISLL